MARRDLAFLAVGLAAGATLGVGGTIGARRALMATRLAKEQATLDRMDKEIAQLLALANVREDARCKRRYAMPQAWPSTPTAESIAGCYTLVFSDWFPQMDLGADASFIAVPRSVELSGAREQGGGERFMLKLAGGSPGSIHHWNWWVITPDRTLELVWSTGYSGVTITLGPAVGGLRGVATTFWDFPRPTQWASVQATRMPCGSLVQ